jgi:hypothetical protein
LIDRGAELVIAARNAETSEAACARLRERGGNSRVQRIDLSDLDSVVRACEGLERDLAGRRAGRIGEAIKRRMMITSERGAQTPLWCATQEVQPGAYYHNTMGRVVVPNDDAACDRAAAQRLWDMLEQLIQGRV